MGSEGVEDWGGEDINDALNMVEVAKNVPEADPDRIAIEGASRGGMTTYMALTRYNRFRCAIVHAGITDVERLCEQKADFKKYLNRLFKGLCDEDRVENLKARSAIGCREMSPCL